jgi:hypothetical protein
MYEYGSEISDQVLAPRKGDVQKASVVRQFRRWNPNFFLYFEHRQGRWVPKLGKKAELERRALARKSFKIVPSQAARGPTNGNNKRRLPSHK